MKKLTRVYNDIHRDAHAVHMALNGTVTVSASVTLAMHFVSPAAEAVAFFVTSLFAIWVNDLERYLRHPALVKVR